MQQSTRDGGVNKWRKAEGDLIKSGDVVCEVRRPTSFNLF